MSTQPTIHREQAQPDRAWQVSLPRLLLLAMLAGMLGLEAVKLLLVPTQRSGRIETAGILACSLISILTAARLFHDYRSRVRERTAALEIAVRAQEESAQRYRSLFERNPDAVYSFDLDGRFLSANAACASLTGYSVEELLHLSFPVTVAPDYLAVTQAHFARAAQGETQHYETVGIRKDGHHFNVSVTNIPIIVGDAITGVYGIAKDITERKIAEEALRQTKENYRSIVDNVVEGVFQTTPDGYYLSANPALAHLYGYDSPEDLMNAIEDVGSQLYVQPGRRAEFIELIRERDVLLKWESQVRRKDGAVIWISENVRAIRDARGSLIYYQGTVEDITARKAAEEALHQTEDKYRNIFENIVEGIYQTTPDGQLVTANAALARMMGYASVSELMQNLPGIEMNYIHPENRAMFTRLMQERGSVSGFEYEIYRKDGTRLWISENARAVRDAQGALLYYEGTMEDITTRKELEAERERLLAEALERADRDPLTGLLNHRAFHKRLEEEADRAQRAGLPLAVAMLDLDNFKFFNDAYGHIVGDDVLRKVAGALRSCCRAYDVLARFGGDEFAVLMPGVGGEEAECLAARLPASLAALRFRPPGHDADIPLSLSVGVAVFPDDAPTRLEVLNAADLRLLQCKSGGADTVEAEGLRAQFASAIEGFSMLYALVVAVDNKDRYTRRHSEDVLARCLDIARALNLDDDVLRTLAVAALLHDVGKIGVPDRILRKPGKLSPEEFEAIRQHPLMGAVIVAAVPGLEETLDAVRHHHERWDGNGYPFGLRGEETPLPARIMAVADAYSAMTTDRPYRKGMTGAAARAILRQGAGTQWDPQCVQAFLSARQTHEAALVGATSPVYHSAQDKCHVA